MAFDLSWVDRQFATVKVKSTDCECQEDDGTVTIKSGDAERALAAVNRISQPRDLSREGNGPQKYGGGR